MKAIVTGGAGFIGSHLANELVRKGYKVTVIDNLSTGSLNNLKYIKNKIKFINCDLSKIKNFKDLFKNVDYIFHLAALSKTNESIKYPKKYYEANVMGTLNILNSIKNIKIKKFIYSASASCYGNSKEIPTSEKAKIELLSPYALTKWTAEQIIMQWASLYKLPVLSLRLFNVYGSRSKATSSYSPVISTFAKQYLEKKSLTVVGKGTQTRSFVYVSDVISAMFLAAKSKISNDIFNVGGKSSVQINNLAKLFGAKKTNIRERPGEPVKSSADIRKIKKVLNWEPKISIKQGINLLINKA